MTDYNEEIFTIIRTNQNSLESYFDEQMKDRNEKFQIDDNIYDILFHYRIFIPFKRYSQTI